MASTKPLTLLTFDAAYLRSLHQGDPAVEQQFVTYFTPLVHARLRRHLRSPQLIQEAAQETFARVLAAVRARGGVRHPERFGAFVQAVCANVAMEVVRREQRFLAMDDVEYEPVATQRSPQSLAEAGETRDMVRRILANLPQSDREILQALFLEDEERATLCARFKVTEGYLRVLVHRAKKRFIEEMHIYTTRTKAAGSKPGAAKTRAARCRTTSVPFAGSAPGQHSCPAPPEPAPPERESYEVEVVFLRRAGGERDGGPSRSCTV